MPHTLILAPGLELHFVELPQLLQSIDDYILERLPGNISNFVERMAVRSTLTKATQTTGCLRPLHIQKIPFLRFLSTFNVHCLQRLQHGPIPNALQILSSSTWKVVPCTDLVQPRP